jgi:ribosomal protein S19
MRSNWKIKQFVNSVYVRKESFIFFKRNGLINPLFLGSKIGVYNGVKFKPFKAREDMLRAPLKSFVACRPSFTSIRAKFKALKKSSKKASKKV